jgi:hypothetical protein
MAKIERKRIRDGGFSSTKVARALGFVVKVGRATTFCLFVLVVGLWIQARRARADVGEHVARLGKDLVQFKDVLQGTHTVLVNGETMFLASAVLDQDKHTVLERFASNCRANAGGLREPFAMLSAGEQEHIATGAPNFLDLVLGVMRDETDDAGMVACIVHGDDVGGLRGTMARLHEVIETGELARIGSLRYASVRRLPDGKSHVLMTFTDGSFNLRRVLGLDGGDVGGSDPPNVPRPPSSRRLLSASADGQPYGVHTFQTSEPPDAVIAYYDEAMPKLGWVKDLDGQAMRRAAFYHRQGVLLTMTAIETQKGVTMVTLLEGSSRNPDPDSATNALSWKIEPKQD